MINNNIVDYNNLYDLIQAAHGAGCAAYIVINGENYTINPDTIPATNAEKNNDLPF